MNNRERACALVADLLGNHGETPAHEWIAVIERALDEEAQMARADEREACEAEALMKTCGGRDLRCGHATCETARSIAAAIAARGEVKR